MSFPTVLPVREQARIVNQTLAKRFERLLPAVMRETGFDAWLIIGHEDNHDPVFYTIVPMEVWAPILQVVLFFDTGSEVERINLSRTNMLGLMPPSPWGPLGEKDQWQVLREVLEQRSPQRIGINTSDVIWAADGLTASLKDRLFESLGSDLASRCESAEPLAIRWLETRLPEELELYEQACAIAHAMIRHCFSRQAITPGVTTTEDLEWTYWQLATDLGLPLSFKPFFRLYRDERTTPAEGTNSKVIQPGDMLHCDVGVEYLRLTTDHQELAYVLRPGETEAPEGLRRGLREANRLQDVFTQSWECGLSGNAILERALQRADAEGISHPKIYSHSLGHLLHEPGPLMGLPWQQTAIPGRGDVVMHENTAYTVELRVDVEVPEWGGQLVAFPIEQDAAITANGVHYIDGRQTDLHLV
ncbi:aminopeptidase P family protein [Aeoliella sp. ICT_H6.2]|uniref:Aminopeptidase P family protein n=1 Tax=Aeoliella straminimaris TaxID=2954799 RepID=A0A9X2FGY1_9BACT|nr:M24 family metallopeptidase [Aeoliella straminimaris]MCO6046339.1 aminopeptidase P family protein [Aeoliella straminimaris]